MQDKTLSLLKKKCINFNILYVEDEENVRTQTSKVLSIYFNNIILAKNGEEGLEKLKNEKINIIFTDINMPKMDGLSMIEHIRKIDKQIPIVVFSAYDNTEYLLKTIEYGVDGYILKPFKFDQIQKVIEKIIEKTQIVHTLNLVDNFKWQIETSTLHQNSKLIKLTKNEIILFKLLSTAKYAVFSSQEIENELFNDDYTDNKRIRGIISRLNKKLNSNIVISVYGQGYELNLEESC